MKTALKFVPLVFFLVVPCVIYCSITDFVQRPSNQTVAQGQVAHLTCQHSSAIELGWNVNDTIITDQDVGEDIQRQRLGSVHQLIIKARPYFNSTRVKCVAYFSNETISSPWAFVIIQGPLDEVTNIVRDPQTRITWEPPFSLNLTGMMIDVLYCILVINVTGGTEKPLFEHCNLTSPYFDDHSLCKGCLYEITVTPYSNGGGSLNGTPSTWRESNDIIPPTSTHQLNNSTVDLRNNTVAQEGTKLAKIVSPVVLIVILILVAVSVAGLIAYMKICKRRNPVKKTDETENIMIDSPRSPSGVSESDCLLQSAQNNSSQVVGRSGVPSEQLTMRRLSYGSATDPEEHSKQTYGTGEGEEEEQIHQSQQVPDSTGGGEEQHKQQIQQAQEVPDDTVVVEVSERIQEMLADGASGGEGGEQIHRSQEVTDSTSGEEQQMQGGSDSTAGAQDGITFHTPDTEGRDESRDPSDQGSIVEGEDGCVSQRQETKQTADQSKEIDESQCKTHGPVTVSCGTSEKISNIVAVTKTGLLIGKGHSENSTFAYQKPNSVADGENNDAITETPAFSDSGDEYIAQGVNNLQGGIPVNVDDPGSRPEQFSSEPSSKNTPRSTRPLEPPRMQAQRVDASGNADNLMPAHVIPQIREADDVSGTRIASFSSDVDGEDKLVTDTPKST